MNDNIRYFFSKLNNRIRFEKVKLYRYLPVENVSICGIGIIPSQKEFVKRLKSILGIVLIDAIRTMGKDEKDSILKAANQTLRHEFDILGSGVTRMDPIKWNKDIKTGYEWPEYLFYLKQRAATSKGSDIKIPWELSRCHHLLWLGEAYILTNDERYAKEVTDELRDWMDKNPLMYTVNWTCAMDVAIRAVNWLYALLFISDSENFTESLVSNVYKSLYQHAFFIYNNLENRVPYSNNHYMSDLVGLLYLSSLFSNNRTGRAWYRFALEEYYREILLQVLPSGVGYEKSVSYHRLMTELAVYSYYMLVRINTKVPAAVKERLIGMVDYVRLNVMPNGLAPMIADGDDGRFIPFVPRNFREHLYITDSSSLESRIVTTGVDHLGSRIQQFNSRLFADSKIAILRKGESYLFINNSDRYRRDKNVNGYVGTHIHNDLLSFVYTVGKEEVMVDPGTYAYTSDIERHKEFRSTAKHNTIMVDREEQHLRNCPATFLMQYNSISHYLELREYPGFDECRGEYLTIYGGVIHSRVFKLEESKLEIIDHLSKKGANHKTSMYFHLSQNIKPVLDGNVVRFIAGEYMYKMTFATKLGITISIKDDTISPSYGVLQNSKSIMVEFVFNEQADIVTIINHN